MNAKHPHTGQPVVTWGSALSEAKAVTILVHGRNSSPRDIIGLAPALVDGAPELKQVAFLAPAAAGGAWYPYPFRTPTAQNQPYLDSALRRISELVAQVNAAGLPDQKIILAGFSQGACLVLEWAARHARRFGGLVGLSGGLIGSDDEPRQDQGHLAGTPVFLGCSDIDFHIPKLRVETSARLLADLGGEVTLRLYPGMGHLVNADELVFFRNLVQQVLKG